MFGNERVQMRRLFFEAWRKHQAGEAMQPLEQMIAGVVLAHPEYHGLLDDPEDGLSRDYSPEAGESNPFLHMAMHIGLLEQISTDRPSGIGEVHRLLSQRFGETHAAEHRMMECLGRMLWEAQTNSRAPDEQAYLDCMRRLLG